MADSCSAAYNTSMRLSLSEQTLRTYNNWLSWVVVGLALYIIVLPVLPMLTFWVKDVTRQQPALVKANSPTPGDATTPPTEVYPAENTLVIPRMNLQETVHEGAGPAVLSKGLWHRPASSSPDKQGNTVIAGHRFTYRGAAVFYHLDKVQPGDTIVLYWQAKKYTYSAVRSYIVPPTAVEIEAPSTEPKLTLYTCTPLWTSKNRLVIEAKLMEVR